jgi:hypothetical protein
MCVQTSLIVVRNRLKIKFLQQLKVIVARTNFEFRAIFDNKKQGCSHLLTHNLLFIDKMRVLQRFLSANRTECEKESLKSTAFVWSQEKQIISFYLFVYFE